MLIDITNEEAQILALTAVTWCNAANEANSKEDIDKSRVFAAKILPMLGTSDEARMLDQAMRGQKKTNSGIIV